MKEKICLILALNSLCMAALYNGNFEWYDYNSITELNEPVGWEFTNYVDIVGNFIPATPPKGNKYVVGSIENWPLDCNIGLLPAEGNKFLILSNEGEIFDAGEFRDFVWEATTTSQYFEVSAGDKLKGYYFFGTTDWYPYDDCAKIKISFLEPDIGDTTIMEISVSDINDPCDFSSMAGWKVFEYAFQQNSIVRIILSVEDVGDGRLDSYLAVDGIILCRNPSFDGDLSCDCTVNFEDYTILTGSNEVNIGNFLKVADNWLMGERVKDFLRSDYNVDGSVNLQDFAILTNEWKKEYGADDLAIFMNDYLRQ